MEIYGRWLIRGTSYKAISIDAKGKERYNSIKEEGTWDKKFKKNVYTKK